MHEAAPATVAAAFARLGLDVIEAGAQPGNAASFAVMRACGMQPIGERDVFAAARGRHERCMFYEVRRLSG
jgi:ribosomal-protein-alanine N-acetyltransferase